MYKVDSAFESDILTPEEVAQYLQKSLSWVYKNWQVLGGRKLGGSLFFPGKEKLYEHIFANREEVEIRLHSEREKMHPSRIHNKTRGSKGRSEQKGGSSQTTSVCGDPNRHRIFGTSE